MGNEVLSDSTIALIKWVYNNYSLSMGIFLVCIMGAVFGLVQLLKKPIKHFTSKIKNETLRIIVNKTIILLSFLVSIGLWYLLNWIIPELVQIDWALMFLSGAMPVVFHAIGDKVINKAKGEKMVETITKVVEDKKVDKDDSPALKELLENIKNYES
jgi:hypothetical protein